ncbi:MAG: CHASE2 domain-containing protein [Granulosicoccus sp.]
MLGSLSYAIQIGNRDFKTLVSLEEYYGLDEKWGLYLLFNLRGSRAPPESVVIVAIDGYSANQLQRKNGTRLWDREYHAQLINRLAKIGAQVVTFDVFLNNARENVADKQLERAIGEHGNIVLYRHLKRRGDTVDIAIDPFQPFAKAAASLGVFALPKIPERVNYYWTFFPVAALNDNHSKSQPPLESLGINDLHDLATLPVSTLHALSRSHEQYPQLIQNISDCRKSSSTVDTTNKRFETNFSYDSLELLRQLFSTDKQFSRCVDSSWKKQSMPLKHESTIIDALLSALTSPTRRYLNFFGPPASVPTISYSTALTAPLDTLSHLSGKTVFVGLSDTQPADQIDGRATVFTDKNGLYLAGVEIAATAFDNLLNDEHIVHLHERIATLLIAAIGFLATLIFMATRARSAIIVYLFFCAIYLTISVYLLHNYMLWVPVINPLFIQLPAIFLLCLIVKNLYARYLRTHYDLGMQALLPKKALGNWQKRMELNTQSDNVFCYCIVTDIAGYTSIVEKLSSEALSALSNAYFEEMGRCVQAHDGEVLFVDGDSMSIAWIKDAPDEEARQLALDCALAINATASSFNITHHETPCVTRIGLSCGWMAAGNMQAGAQFMYRIHGDAVVTASRLESLNKHLGTSILATRELTQGLNRYLFNSVGTFVLDGKEEAVEIDEVLCHTSSADSNIHQYVHECQHALSVLRNGNKREARALLHVLDKKTGGNPLCQFYLDMHGENDALAIHQIDDEGVVYMTSK